MTRKYLWLVLCAALLLFAACQKAPELTITSPSSIELSADGSSGSITFTANRDWSVSTSDSWVTVSPSSGKVSDGPVTVTVRCNANTTYDDRTATVTIRMEELSQTVTVRQPANLGVVLPKQTFDLQSDAKSIEVEVQANVQYTVSTSVNWIKQIGTKGLTSKTLTFSIEENKTYDAREGKITIKPQESGAQEQVISVRQAQKDALNVEKTSYDMPYGGGEIEINVEANVSFDVTPNTDWIHYVETKALSSSTVCLSIEENRTYKSREGKVEIQQENGSIIRIVTISQGGDPEIPIGAVDLGMILTREDGTTYKLYWAECNLGANTPEEYGDFYAWGETEVKSEYSWLTYKWANGDYNKLTKYCPLNMYGYWAGPGKPDGKNTLDYDDDAAHMILGGNWRMPTKTELEALVQCAWTKTTINGVNGYEVHSKENSNSLFLPFAGFWDEGYADESTGVAGFYWSSSTNLGYPDGWPYVAYFLHSTSEFNIVSEYFRYNGYSIRPVTE